MKTIKTEIYTEICCELCNEVIHNHFDCPVCKKEYAGTSEYAEFEDGVEFKCQECGSRFIYNGYNDNYDETITILSEVKA